MKLHYDSEGDGPLVVLLHGFPESRLSWKRQLPALAQAGFRAVAPDLRGYGDSPKPKGIDHYRIPLVAEDVIELIESLSGGQKCVLVGHDWGAVVAWNIAMTRPDLLRKLAIINIPHPSAILREVRRSFRQKINLTYQIFFQLPVLPELTMRLFGRAFLKRAARFTAEEIETYVQQWRGNLTPMLNYYRAMRRSRGKEVKAQFHRVETPTLIIWGEREPVFLSSAIEDLDRWVADVRIERLPRIGHFAQHDAAERVNELLVEWAGS
ncbi:MAG TPA: alpha/beta hydrolase [Thermoanaerobaculia bacterium]